MTAKGVKMKGGSLFCRVEPQEIGAALLSVFLLLLLLKDPEMAISKVSGALKLCAVTVIPALFPFMVVSEMIVSSGAVSFISKHLEKPCQKLFGIGGDGSAAIILGLLCGSPIGAKCAASLYRNGSVTRNEYARLLTFTNTPSAAFIINAVGASMFGSKSFGTELYVISIFSALTVGFLGSRLSKTEPKDRSTSTQKRKKGTQTRSASVYSLFTSAVTSSAVAMLNICAFITFFSALTGAMDIALDSLTLPVGLKGALIGIFEMTGGVGIASRDAFLGRYSAAFLIGWSGLSVHFQLMSICSGDGVSFRPYFGAKFGQGLINVALLAILSGIFK